MPYILAVIKIYSQSTVMINNTLMSPFQTPKWHKTGMSCIPTTFHVSNGDPDPIYQITGIEMRNMSHKTAAFVDDLLIFQGL